MLNRFLGAIYRYNSLLNLLINKLKYATIHFGLNIEITKRGKFCYKDDIRIGSGTRIDIFGEGSELSIGNQVNISRNVYLYCTDDQVLTIGDLTSIQDGCRIYGDVSIGQCVIFAPNVFLSSGSHIFKEKPNIPIIEQDALYKFNRPIVIEDDCWIGINAVIMPGVTIAKGSIAGSGSVVTKSFPPYSVIAGSPAKIINKRLEFNPPDCIESPNDKDLPYFYSGFDLYNRVKNIDIFGGFCVDGSFSVSLHKDVYSKIKITCKRNKLDIVFLKYNNQQFVVDTEFVVIEFKTSCSGGHCANLFMFFATDAIIIKKIELV